MNLPLNSPIPLDPPPADPVENRLRQAAPAPLNAALMARLRLARPDLDAHVETAPDSNPETALASISTAETEAEGATIFSVTLAASPQVIPFPGRNRSGRRRPGSRGFWSVGAAAAAMALCGWVGWKAAAPVIPGGDGAKAGGPAMASQGSSSTPAEGGSAGSGNGDGSLEFLPALESRQQLLSVKDLGVFRDSRQRPVQLMSATWLDENTYGSTLDPELRESRVRHEIVPVVLPTY